MEDLQANRVLDRDLIEGAVNAIQARPGDFGYETREHHPEGPTERAMKATAS